MKKKLMVLLLLIWFLFSGSKIKMEWVFLLCFVLILVSRAKELQLFMCM